MKIKKKSTSILNKFLIFNFFAFIILGLFTFFYLKAIQPELVKQRTEKHNVIINNTANHIERLQIKFEENSIKDFLLSTRFLFQNLERVQFYDLEGKLIADTNVLDLDKNVFSKSDEVFQENLSSNKSSAKKNLSEVNKIEGKEQKNNSEIKNLISKKQPKEEAVVQIEENNNFYVKTLNDIIINGEIFGYIMVTEQANEILVAVEERRNFILRTVFAIAIAIFVFSIFLNKYILTPIAALVGYTDSIKAKLKESISDPTAVKAKTVGSSKGIVNIGADYYLTERLMVNTNTSIKVTGEGSESSYGGGFTCSF